MRQNRQSNFLADALAIFLFVVWLWLLITVTNDLFRRHDISGWGKAASVIGLILFSYLAIFIYLITQGKSVAQRNAEQAKEARAELDKPSLRRRRQDGQARRAEGVRLDQRRRVLPPAREARAVTSALCREPFPALLGKVAEGRVGCYPLLWPSVGVRDGHKEAFCTRAARNYGCKGSGNNQSRV